jgi:hypothetical protein
MSRKIPPLELSRSQILGFRRRVGSLDERLPAEAKSLRRAAWAGLQDSSPRAALLSIHARVEEATSTSWAHPSLVQLWGPRYNNYVVAAQDIPVFSLGRLPEDARRRARAHDTASRLHVFLDGRRMPFGRAGREMGVPHNSLRYAAPTGTVLLRWDGSRQPVVWTVPAPDMDPWQARLELARRYLHVFGPTTPASFARWAGIGRAEASAAFKGLAGALTAVRTTVGDGWILADDEMVFRSKPGGGCGCTTAARRRCVLPSVGSGSRDPCARGEATGRTMDNTRLAGSGTRAWGDRWSVAAVGGRGFDRPLAPTFIGGVGGGRGRGVVASAARPDYRPAGRR